MSEITIEDSYRQIEESTANLVRVDGIIDGLLQERQLLEKLLVNYQGIRVNNRRIIELATKIIEKRLSNDG